FTHTASTQYYTLSLHDALPISLATSIESAKKNFTEAMDNDFNTASAVAALFEFVKAINTARDNGATNDQLSPAQSVFKELAGVLDRKSTRLNSSHVKISYAVFC